MKNKPFHIPSKHVKISEFGPFSDPFSNYNPFLSK
jgi:hypothetical protein